jgi:hypothetical protein
LYQSILTAPDFAVLHAITGTAFMSAPYRTADFAAPRCTLQQHLPLIIHIIPALSIVCRLYSNPNGSSVLKKRREFSLLPTQPAHVSRHET